MTNARFHTRPVAKSFNNLMDDLFTTMPSLLRDGSQAGFKQSVPVNIREGANGYELEVVAPGFTKEDFKINLENNILTISADKKAGEASSSEKQIRTEFRHQSFSRSFTVDDHINGESIGARYTNGILTLNLPKKEEVKPAVKQISIQ